jgi:hypothetical protein
MMVQRYWSKAAVICFALALSAGLAREAHGQDWQPILKEDLALKDNPASPGANAMLLYRENKVDGDESAVYEYRRIKIFTDNGKELADVEVPFVKGEYDVKDVRARTIKPDGTIVNFDGKVYEKVVYKSGGLKWMVKSFTLPEVQPGCIIEYKYHEQWDRQYYVNVAWGVQNELYTRRAKFTMQPPRYMPNAVLYWRTYGIPKTTQPEKKGDSYVMEVHDLPGLEEEEFMLPRKILQARVEFYYREIGDPQGETPERYWKRIGKKWDDQLERFIDRRSALESALSQIVGAGDSPETKLRKIYAFVQKQRDTSYDLEKTEKETKQENLKSNDNVEDVLKHGYADGRQINFLFVGLARAAGFESSEVYLAPRDKVWFSPDLMDSSQLAADVVWVRLGGKDIYLDPAARYYSYGLLPWFETETKGLRLNKQGGDFVNTNAPVAEDSLRERHVDLNLDAEGNVSGTITIDYTGQTACLKREAERNEDDEGRKKGIERTVRESLPADATFDLTQMKGWEDNNVPLHIEGKLRMSGFGATTGRRILAPATIFKSTQVKAFQPSKRRNDIYFSFPYLEKDDITLHVPQGYSLETVPAAINSPPRVLQYSLTTAADGNGVKVHRELNVSEIYFKVDYYQAVRQFFDLVRSGDETQLVLASAQTAERK